MEENKPAEVATEVVTAPAAVIEAATEKPKRKRTPRKPKEEAVTAAPKRERKPKMVHEVVQDGKFVHLRGTDVVMDKLTPKQREAVGIKAVEGKLGVPCAEPVTLTFKSVKAAAQFFERCFTDEDGTHNYIHTSGKADWLSDDLADMLG